MSLKMDAIFPEVSLEIFLPICYRGKHRLQGDIFRCFHEGSLQAVQVLVALSASHVLQNNPRFIVQGLRSGLTEVQISALKKGENVSCSQS